MKFCIQIYKRKWAEDCNSKEKVDGLPTVIKNIIQIFINQVGLTIFRKPLQQHLILCYDDTSLHTFLNKIAYNLK